MTSELLAPIFGSDSMRAVFDDAARIRAMLTFEAALAGAEADAGVIPEDAAALIAAACETFRPNIRELGHAAREQSAPSIPFVKALTAHCPEEARGWVHWGATSQDVIDTALVLQMREGCALIEADIDALGDLLAALATDYRSTVMAGRTLLQPALPITFGFKCAGWLDALADARTGLARATGDALVLQFGGAVGTLSALGEDGEAVRQALGRRLELPVPAAPWHTNRTRIVRLCGELALLANVLSKIAGDMALLMQPEIGELAEPAGDGRGGSSTMPHKRNPVSAVAVRANAHRVNGLVSTLQNAMAHEHERGAGGWQVEWTTVPELFELAAGSLAHLRATLDGLTVDAGRMRANLEVGGGTMMAEALMMALAPHTGRLNAHHLIGELARKASETGASLGDVAKQDSRVIEQLGPAEIDRAVTPDSYLGRAEDTVDAVLARWKEIRAGGIDADT